VTQISAALIATLILSGCGWFGKPEEYKSEGSRTTYRSAETSPSESVTPAPQKIPGEKR